jgi:hypothetical protein
LKSPFGNAKLDNLFTHELFKKFDLKDFRFLNQQFANWTNPAENDPIKTVEFNQDSMPEGFDLKKSQGLRAVAEVFDPNFAHFTPEELFNLSHNPLKLQ